MWKDPYLTSADRGDTERSVSGLSLRWHNAMDTPLSVEISSQEIDIDDEGSGASLALTAADQRLLRRAGQVYRYHLEYAWPLRARHVIVPAISYPDYQLDGAAMAEDGIALQLSHEYRGVKWTFLSSILYKALMLFVPTRCSSRRPTGTSMVSRCGPATRSLWAGRTGKPALVCPGTNPTMTSIFMTSPSACSRSGQRTGSSE